MTMNKDLALLLTEGFEAFDREDYSIAFEILLPLAEAGVLDAQTTIAGMYMVGKGTTADRERAIEWYRIAANKGDMISQNNLATMILSESPLESIKWYEMAAEQNMIFAQDCLGDIYAGFLPSKPIQDFKLDYQIAIKWYKLAWEGGSSIACYRLGMIYEQGLGVELDIHIALEYYKMALNAGFPQAALKIDQLESVMQREIKQLRR
jgi:uncharacterized protein